MQKLTAENAIEMLKYFPKRPPYDIWINVISALGNYFGDQTALDILFSHWDDYANKPNETEDKLLKYRLRNIQIGTFVWYAKKFGYKPKKTYINRHSKDFRHKAMVNYNEIIKPLVTNEKPKLYDLVTRPPENEKQTYLIGINKSVYNKNCDTITKKPLQNHFKFNNEFRNEILNTDQLITAISKGHSILCSHLKGRNKVSENFLKSNCFGIDVDSGLTINQALSIKETERALLLYTTCTHTETKHRYRLIFPLSKTIFADSINDYSKLIEYFVKLYSGDTICKNISRGFFGNSNSKIINFISGEVLQYKDSVLTVETL